MKLKDLTEEQLEELKEELQLAFVEWTSDNDIENLDVEVSFTMHDELVDIPKIK